MKHVGWMVITDSGPMFWPPDELDQAISYCEDAAMPVQVFANEAELSAHEKAQGDGA